MTRNRETIVLIHGYGFDPRVWSPVEIAFEGFDVVYLTLPGFGEDTVPVEYSISGLAGQYLDIVSQRTDGRFHLVGHSMGGYGCMEMIAQKPDRIASLVLLHSHVFEDSAEKKEQRTKTLEEIQNVGHGPLVHRMIPSLFAAHRVPVSLIDALVARGMQYSQEAWYYGAMAMRDRVDHAMTLAHMHVPVMIIAGALDAAIPLEFSYRMAALAERCQLRVYEDVGHMSMYECVPDLADDLRGFYLSFEK